MRTTLFGNFVGCCLAVSTCAAADDPAPTPATLAAWLADKEVVEFDFAGPHSKPLKLLGLLKTKVDERDSEFRVSPGEGGGKNRAFVRVCLKATPAKVRRLLVIQEELRPHGYLLDAETARVWSYQATAAARAAALAMKPDFFVAFERDLKQRFPAVKCRTEKHVLRYEIPGTGVHGQIRVNAITAGKHWEGAVRPDQYLHLPHLGLMIQSYYGTGGDWLRKEIALPHAAIRTIFGAASQRFITLEPGAVVKRAEL